MKKKDLKRRLEYLSQANSEFQDLLSNAYREIADLKSQKAEEYVALIGRNKGINKPHEQKQE